MLTTKKLSASTREHLINIHLMKPIQNANTSASKLGHIMQNDTEDESKQCANDDIDHYDIKNIDKIRELIAEMVALRPKTALVLNALGKSATEDVEINTSDELEQTDTFILDRQRILDEFIQDIQGLPVYLQSMSETKDQTIARKMLEKKIYDTLHEGDTDVVKYVLSHEVSHAITLEMYLATKCHIQVTEDGRILHRLNVRDLEGQNKIDENTVIVKNPTKQAYNYQDYLLAFNELANDIPTRQKANEVVVKNLLSGLARDHVTVLDIGFGDCKISAVNAKTITTNLSPENVEYYGIDFNKSWDDTATTSLVANGILSDHLHLHTDYFGEIDVAKNVDIMFAQHLYSASFIKKITSGVLDETLGTKGIFITEHARNDILAIQDTHLEFFKKTDDFSKKLCTALHDKGYKIETIHYSYTSDPLELDDTVWNEFANIPTADFTYTMKHPKSFTPEVMKIINHVNFLAIGPIEALSPEDRSTFLPDIREALKKGVGYHYGLSFAIPENSEITDEQLIKIVGDVKDGFVEAGISMEQI